MNHDDTPPVEEYPPMLLDAPLVTTLTCLFALGYIEQMAGRPVEDDDLIAGVDALEIERWALAFIAQAETYIHEQYGENPQLVHNGLYAAGRATYAEQEREYLVNGFEPGD